MDKLTLAPDENGYGFADGLEALRSQLDGGQGAYGAGIRNAAISLSVQWTCDATEYEYLRSAYRTHVEEGHAPFLIDLFINSLRFVEYSVRITPGTFGLTSHQGLQYVVGCTLEVQPIAHATASAPLPKFTLPPDKASYNFQDAAEVNVTPLDGGLGRARRDLIGASTKINVRWRTNAAGFLYIRDHYKAWTTIPEESFAIDLLIDTAALVEYQVHYVPGSMRLTSVSGETVEVACQLETVVANDTVDCDCSMIAWSINFEAGSAIRGGVQEYIGSSNFEFTRDPLYGSGSRWWGAEDSDEIYLVDPAVEINEEWSLYYSVKFYPDSLNGVGNFETLDVWDTSNFRYVRTWVSEYDDDGTPKIEMKIFYVPSFSQQAVSGLLYDTRYDICHVMGGGRFRTFINGVKVNDQSATAAGISSVDVMWNEGSHLPQPATFDEIHVVNVAEHDADYAVDLPRCTCPLPPVEIGWYENPTSPFSSTPSPTNFGHDDFTGSTGEIELNFALMDGLFREVQILSWIPVIPGSPEPTIFVGSGTNSATFYVKGAQDPDSNQLYDGVATIGGEGINGYLIFTVYHNDDTGGYGGVAWSHSGL